jgi:DNA-binding transcriptional LysR family regulator
MVDYRVRTFLQLYETMNYRHTAELLRLSQPAVTQQIHSLEREYGYKLFVYDGKRLHHTPEADCFAEYARAAIYNEQQLRQELSKTTKKKIRMGATRSIGDFVIPEYLSRYIQRTTTDFTIVVDNTAVLLQKLEHEELDFALVEGSFDKRKYGYFLYQNAQFSGICHISHPFAGKTVTIQDLAGQDVILREKGSGTRAILENALAEYGYSVDLFSRVICVSSFSLIARFVGENAGVSFAYAAVAAGRENITDFHLDCLNEVHEFNFVYLKGTKVIPMIQEIFGPLVL